MLITDTPSFYSLVKLLRSFPREIQFMAAYAAQCWTDETLAAAEAKGDLPGRDGGAAQVGRLN